MLRLAQTEGVSGVLEELLGQYVGPFCQDWDHVSCMVEFALSGAWQECLCVRHRSSY